MEERPFLLNQEVMLADERGPIGKGVVIGRSFTAPMKYDIRIRDTIYAGMPAEVLKYVQ